MLLKQFEYFGETLVETIRNNWFCEILCETKKPPLRCCKGGFFVSSDPAGTRTQDPNIKSVMLYRLSYGIINRFRLKWCKYRAIWVSMQALF